MKTALLMISLIILSGCGFYRTMDVTITGKDIKSPYGNGDGDIKYHSQWGFCHADKSN